MWSRGRGGIYHAPRKILVFILWLWDKLRAKDIGKRNPSDARTVFKKLLCHNSKGLGEILEGGLVIAFGLICEGQLHLELLAQPQDITLGDLIKLDFVRHTPFVMHSKYWQLKLFLCKVGNGITIHHPTTSGVGSSHNGAEAAYPFIIKWVETHPRQHSPGSW